MPECAYDSSDPEIYWDNRYERRVYDDPAYVVFDTRMEIAVGFERAYASYERDIMLATERKAVLAMEEKAHVVKFTNAPKKLSHKRVASSAPTEKRLTRSRQYM